MTELEMMHILQAQVSGSGADPASKIRGSDFSNIW